MNINGNIEDKNFESADDWGDAFDSVTESKVAAEPAYQMRSNETPKRSFEETRFQESIDKLSQIESIISQVEKLQEKLEVANSNLKSESVSTQRITEDLLSTVPSVRKIGYELKTITEAIKGQLTNVELSVSERSYETTKWRLEATAEAAFCEGIKKCSEKAHVAISDSVRFAMSGVDEKLNAFKESFSADLAKYDQEIKVRKEELKKIEEKVKGKFLTEGQFYYMITGYLLFLSAAVLGMSRFITPERAPAWVGFLIASALGANLIWYALKFAWKGAKWLWRRIPGNDD
ncbi:hypothetical protein ACTQ53_14720 [Prevotella sp. Sow4_E9_plate]|uniref:hypothetical protein n=1 Tax=Prevotella sp. Sow4_E9_plate TaxID=3438802 RepID=UPI003F98E1D5